MIGDLQAIVDLKESVRADRGQTVIVLAGHVPRVIVVQGRSKLAVDRNTVVVNSSLENLLDRHLITHLRLCSERRVLRAKPIVSDFCHDLWRDLWRDCGDDFWGDLLEIAILNLGHFFFEFNEAVCDLYKSVTALFICDVSRAALNSVEKLLNIGDGKRVLKVCEHRLIIW